MNGFGFLEFEDPDDASAIVSGKLKCIMLQSAANIYL